MNRKTHRFTTFRIGVFSLIIISANRYWFRIYDCSRSLNYIFCQFAYYIRLKTSASFALQTYFMLLHKSQIWNPAFEIHRPTESAWISSFERDSEISLRWELTKTTLQHTPSSRRDISRLNAEKHRITLPVTD